MNTGKFYFIFVLVCGLLLCGESNAQDSIHPKGLYIRVGVAYTPLTGAPSLHPLIDPLISLPAHNVTFNYEVQWQINRRFGLIFQYNYLNNSTDVRGDFEKALQREFPDDFVAARLDDLPFNQQQGEGPVQGMLGCSYAFDAGKWSIQPRALIGGSTFYPLAADVALKRRDSNQLTTLVLKPSGAPEDGAVSSFTYGLGTLVQRHLGKRWSLYGMVEWTTFKNDLRYSYSLKNQVDGAEFIQNFASGNSRSTYVMHAGAGLAFRLTRKPKSR